MSQNKKYDCTSHAILRKAVSKNISFHFSNFCQKGKKMKRRSSTEYSCYSFSLGFLPKELIMQSGGIGSKKGEIYVLYVTPTWHIWILTIMQRQCELYLKGIKCGEGALEFCRGIYETE